MSRTALYLALPGENLDALFSEFREVLRDHPFATVFVAPTARIAQVLQRRLAGEGLPFIPSSITTLRDLARTLFEAHAADASPLSDIEVKLVLAHLLSVNRERLPIFYSRGSPSPRLVSDLQTLVSVLITRKVPYPDCLGDLQSGKSDQIRCIFDAYTRYLEENRRVDGDTVLRWAIRWLADHPSFRYRAIFFYGLYEPLPLEREFIRALQDHAETCVCSLSSGGDARVFPDGGSWLNPDTVHAVEPGSPLRSNIAAVFSPRPRWDASPRIAIGTRRDRTTEIRSIAEEIRSLIDAGVAPGEIAVAFPDLSRGVARVSGVFPDFGIPFDAASGEPLAQSRIVQTVFQVLAVAAFDYRREHVVALLKSPYIRYTWNYRGRTARLSADDVDVESRISRILGGRAEWLLHLDARLRTIREASPGSGGQALAHLERMRDGLLRLFEDLKALEGEKSIGGHVSALRFLLNRLEYPRDLATGGAAARENADLAQIAAILDALERFSDAHPPLTLPDFHRLLSTLVSDARSTPLRNPHAVQVMGIRELAHASFAYTFIADLVEGEMPRLTTRLPFTNDQEIRRMGTRTRAEVLREERYHFIAALLAGREGVYLSSAESDGDSVLISSRFLVDLMAAATVRPWDAAPSRHSLLDADTRLGAALSSGAAPAPHRDLADIVSRLNVENCDRRGSYRSAHDGVLSGDAAICAELGHAFDRQQVYSPTMLETYAACPFRFYLRYVLHLEPFPDLEPELTAKERGSLLHEIAFRFFTEWRSSGHGAITEVHLPRALETVSAVARRCMERYARDSPLWEATREEFLGQNGMGPGLLEQFLRYESGTSSFLPAHFEFSFGLPIAEGGCDAASVPDPVPLGDDDAILIRGKIDRVDMAEDGSFVILDYKTGGVHPRFRDIRDGVSFQLPLYIAALERLTKRRGIGGVYYTVRPRKIRKYAALWDPSCANAFAPFSKDASCRDEDFRRVLADSLANARRHTANIRSGLFHPAAEIDRCPSFCEYATVCRFDPLRILELRREEGADDAH